MIKRLLLVEDDAALARILGAALGEEGFSVTLAATGAEGLRLFEAAPPDQRPRPNLVLQALTANRSARYHDDSRGACRHWLHDRLAASRQQRD